MQCDILPRAGAICGVLDSQFSNLDNFTGFFFRSANRSLAYYFEYVGGLFPLCTTRPVPALIAMCRDHESLNLQQFEGLMALTNLASLDNVKSRIVAEKGISCFQYLQVQQYGPCLCDLMLVPRAVLSAVFFGHSEYICCLFYIHAFYLAFDGSVRYDTCLC